MIITFFDILSNYTLKAIVCNNRFFIKTAFFAAKKSTFFLTKIFCLTFLSKNQSFFIKNQQTRI